MRVIRSSLKIVLNSMFFSDSRFRVDNRNPDRPAIEESIHRDRRVIARQDNIGMPWDSSPSEHVVYAGVSSCRPESLLRGSRKRQGTTPSQLGLQIHSQEGWSMVTCNTKRRASGDMMFILEIRRRAPDALFYSDLFHNVGTISCQ